VAAGHRVAEPELRVVLRGWCVPREMTGVKKHCESYCLIGFFCLKLTASSLK